MALVILGVRRMGTGHNSCEVPAEFFLHLREPTPDHCAEQKCLLIEMHIGACMPPLSVPVKKDELDETYLCK